MASNESTNHLFGTIVGINIPSKTIYSLSFDNIRSIAYNLEDDHFARLLYYYQQDAEKVLSCLPVPASGQWNQVLVRGLPVRAILGATNAMQ